MKHIATHSVNITFTEEEVKALHTASTIFEEMRNIVVDESLGFCHIEGNERTSAKLEAFDFYQFANLLWTMAYSNINIVQDVLIINKERVN